MEKSFICLAVTESTLDNNIKRILEYKDHIDMVELRADFLDKEELRYLDKFPGMTDIPAILTIRRKSDGGMYTSGENERCALLEKGSAGKYQFVDLEEDLENEDITARIKEKGKTIIRSFHDFNGVPHDLASRIKKSGQRPGEIPKAAVMPLCTKDLDRLLHSYKECKGIRKILLGMGTFGFPTRILASYLGSFLTYCSAPQKCAAPGHIDPVALENLYRFRNISRNTALYGIIGNPVMHTLSPAIHNRGFSQTGLDAVYIPFQVDSVKDFFPVAEFLDIKGFSVTIPHKEEVIRYLTQQDKSVEQIAACNTVLRLDPGWRGVNTDGTGFMEPLRENKRLESFNNLRATVIGAGGGAKAVVFSLVSEGVDVLILNRTVGKAEMFASPYHCAWGGLDSEGLKRMSSYSDIIVQTTKVGMEPDIQGDPVPGYRFKGHEIAYDIVYKPAMTNFLKRAEQAGCTIIQGKEMLLGQGFVQFRLFTGKEYPDKAGIKALL
ncbi:MAG: shikimate dehydrogenase [Spirochaetales bacterium]|nr:shikimate dehydrogenase [Spirochaetales bacterium]